MPITFYGPEGPASLPPSFDALEIAYADQEALAYSHSTPVEMERIKERHRRAAEEAKERSTLTPPEN